MEGNCHRTIATATNIAFEGSFTRHCRPAIATLLSGLGNDGRRKRLKLQPQSFIPTTIQGSAFSPDSSSGACAAEIKL